MYKFPLLIVALVLAAPLRAELPADTLVANSLGHMPLGRVKRVVDRVLDLRDLHRRPRADTAYIVRAPERLRLKVSLNSSGSDLDTRWSGEGDKCRSLLRAQAKNTMSLTASYRGLSLSLSLNPAKLAGRNKDYELNLNAYGNRLGADLILQSAKTYEGTVETPSGVVEVPTGSVSQDMVTANAYYVFSGRRFSFPAAFTQSWLQRRSAGSIMLGLSFVAGRIKADRGDVLGSGAARLSLLCGSVGAGYAYNWVFKRDWLLCVSLAPAIGYKRTHSNLSPVETGTGEDRPFWPSLFNLDNFNIDVTGRIGLVWNNTKYFGGLSLILHNYNYRHNRLSINNTFGTLNLYLGLNFHKRKAYR